MVFFGFGSQHVPHLGALLKSICQVTQRAADFEWDQEQEKTQHLIQVAALRAALCRLSQVIQQIQQSVADADGGWLRAPQGGTSQTLEITGQSPAVL